MFDYVRVENGRIVERVQQADLFGQMRQLYGRLLLGMLIAAAAILVGFGMALEAALR